MNRLKDPEKWQNPADKHKDLNLSMPEYMATLESDEVKADNNTIIFDPWRTYPKADNVVYYGK